MNHRLIEGLMEAIAPLIRDYVGTAVQQATAPLIARISELESCSIKSEVARAVEALPKPADGKSVTIDDVRPLIEEAVGKLPPAKDGKDADPAAVAALISSEVARAVEALPKPADGKSVTLDDVRPLIEGAVARLPPAKDGMNGKDGVGLAGAVIDRSGNLCVTMTDGSVRDLGVVVGAPGQPGRDGFSLKDFDTELLPDGRTMLLKFGSGDVLETHEFCLHTIIDRGVWRQEGYSGYANGGFMKGDAVSHGGSLFIAQRDTTAKPGESDDWRLAVKRGRDGKDAAPVKEGSAQIRLR